MARCATIERNTKETKICLTLEPEKQISIPALAFLTIC